MQLLKAAVNSTQPWEWSMLIDGTAMPIVPMEAIDDAMCTIADEVEIVADPLVECRPQDDFSPCNRNLIPHPRNMSWFKGYQVRLRCMAGGMSAVLSARGALCGTCCCVVWCSGGRCDAACLCTSPHRPPTSW